METRSIRADFNKSNPSKVSGYAIRYGTPTQINERNRTFTEVIAPGAAEIEPELKLLWSHDESNVLGSLSGGTAQIRQDSTGVFVEAVLPESATREREALARGDVDSFSFRFVVVEDSWQGQTRTVKKMKVSELSLVAFPSYPTARVMSLRQHEQRMRLQDLREKYFVHAPK